MKTNLLTLVVTLTVGIILAGSLLMPVITDATTTEKTFTNEGFYYMQKVTADDTNTYTLAYEYSSGTYTFKYNDEAIDITSIGNLATTLATDGESWVLRSQYNEYVGLQSVGTDFISGGHNTVTSTYTFNQGTATCVATNTSDVSSTKTTTYDELWIYSPTPTDYVMKKATSNAYLLEDSEYLAMGITAVTSWSTVIKITGDLEDFDAEIVYPTGVTTTVTNKEIHKAAVDGYVGLSSLEKLTFTISDGTSTVDATYSYFIVPATVTAELADHLNPAEIALMNALPILIIMGLVVLAAGALVIKNRD